MIGQNTQQQTLANLKANWQRAYNDALNQVRYYEQESARYPDSTEVKDRLAFWRAEAATYAGMLGLTLTQITQIQTSQGFGNYIQSKRNGFLQTQQKFDNALDEIFDTGGEFLTEQYAGIPFWGWLLIGGAGLYFLFSGGTKSAPKRIPPSRQLTA